MKRNGRATLAEIASRARVSVTTVSNVINGRFNLMSPGTRERVEKEIRQLNYRPHEGARNLRLARQQTIGLIVLDDSPRFLADPMTSNIVAGLSNWLSANGFGLLISGASHANAADVPMLRRNQTDALCVMPSGSAAERRAIYERLRDTGQPVVVFQDTAPAFLADALTVRQDDAQAGAMLAAHVIGRGARRLAFLAPARAWPAMIARQTGVARMADERGAALDLVICASESSADTEAAIERHIDRSGLPDAFLGGNDQMALAALGWAQRRGIAVPHELRIAGFNGFDVFSLARPELTTIISPAYEMGRQGARQLLLRLGTGRFSQRELLFDISLRPGETC